MRYIIVDFIIAIGRKIAMTGYVLINDAHSVAKEREKKKTLRVGFEPTREDHIGFQVQRLNRSAIAAVPHRSYNS